MATSLQSLTPYLLLFAIAVIPVRLAAKLFGLTEAKLFNCALAVFVGSIVCYAFIKSLNGTSIAVAIAFIALVFTYKMILQPSFTVAVGITVIALLIQTGLVSALYSFGVYVDADLMSMIPLVSLR